MSSNPAGSNGGSAVTFADDSTRDASLFGQVAGQKIARDSAGDSRGALACAAAAMERLEREIEDLWRNSMKAKDPGLSERLAEVSHALQRAARLLEQGRAIG
jgi:hypothetical protein